MSRSGRPLPRRHGDVVGVVVVPPGEDGRFVTSTDLDGHTLLHHALRTVAEVAADVVLLAAAEDADRLRGGLRRAGLGAVLTGTVAGGDDLGGAVGRTLGARERHAPVAALLVHDPCCPLAPSWHLSDVLTGLRGADGGYRAGAAVHPMTDTVKQVRPETGPVPGAGAATRAGATAGAAPEAAAGVAVAGTVDRDRLRVLTSPVVVPARHARHVPALADGPGLVTALRGVTDVALVPAPPIARRVGDRAGLHLVVGLREVEEHRGRRTV